MNCEIFNYLRCMKANNDKCTNHSKCAHRCLLALPEIIAEYSRESSPRVRRKRHNHFQLGDFVSCFAAMSGLFECEHPATWRRVEGKYWDVVEAKNKKPGKLLQLDKWYQEELPVIISSRCEKYVTLAEVVKLMEWKLTRGKFRPRLQQLVSSNSEDAVDKCSRKAFSLLPDVAAAIAELSSLKGVGPATASAVLAVAAPDQAAFMSDEALESVPGLKPIQYTAKHYSLYQNKMVAMTNRLNKVDPRPDWTPQRLERCLWALSVAKQQQLPFLDDLDVKGGGVVEEHMDADHRASKKLKTR